MKQKLITSTMIAIGFGACAVFGQVAYASDESGGVSMYDESAYTEHVEKTMKKLDKLYLQFCGTCGVSGAKAEKAKMEYFKTVRDLLQQMNAKFDSLDPKKGAALSDTETLVSIHVLTMLVDMLTATQLETTAEHPHN
jgi:uncharacterized FAD-dependent dehydrogenase